MKKSLIFIILASVVFTGYKKEEKNTNPFFNKFDTPFEVPPFERTEKRARSQQVEISRLFLFDAKTMS